MKTEEPGETWRTSAARLEEPGAPLHFGAPPNLMSFPKATGQSALHEPVAAEVIPILDDLVSLPRRLFLGRAAQIYVCHMAIKKGPLWKRKVRGKKTLYPMNHAPLAPCVPFCRQARKWCPPATLSQHVPQTGK